MTEVEWKKRSTSTAAAVYNGHDNDNVKKQQQKNNKLGTGRIFDRSKIRVFRCSVHTESR